MTTNRCFIFNSNGIGGHGPQYRKISLIGGGSGGGGSYLSVPAVASASITSAASLAVPNRHRRPLSANYVEIKPRLSSYYSRSGGSGHGAVVGNGYLGRGTTNCKGSVLGSRQNGLRDRLQLTSKNFDLNEPDGGHWSRLQSFARPTCHHSGGGFCC